MSTTPRKGFCIYIETLFQGPTLAVREGEDVSCVFATENEAQREIVDNAMTRLQQFLDGERDYDDAITVEEYVVPVTVLPDGSVVDEDGRRFGTEVCKARVSAPRDAAEDQCGILADEDRAQSGPRPARHAHAARRGLAGAADLGA